jgi:hypothetical protein
MRILFSALAAVTFLVKGAPAAAQSAPLTKELAEACLAIGAHMRNEIFLTPDQVQAFMRQTSAPDAITQFDLPHVMNRTPRVGMSQCAALAALGSPTNPRSMPPLTVYWHYNPPGTGSVDFSWDPAGNRYFLSDLSDYRGRPQQQAGGCVRHFYNQSNFDWGVALLTQARTEQPVRVPARGTVVLNYNIQHRFILIQSVIPATNAQVYQVYPIVYPSVHTAGSCPAVKHSGATQFVALNDPASGDVKTCEADCRR